MDTTRALIALLLAAGTCAGDTLPQVSDRKPLESPWLPSRLHAFVWRNWELVDTDRLARTIGTDAESIRRIGTSLGLPPAPSKAELKPERSYITIIRRNWHLLPWDQLLTLLDWDAPTLATALREDDFLWHKLGALKPNCPPLRYSAPDETESRACERIRTLLAEEFGGALTRPEVPRFDFLRDLATASPTSARPPQPDTHGIRFLYSYFALYGDPLLDPKLDPFPDGLLQRLADRGVNGVWIHTVLRQLAPSTVFPEFGAGHEKRLETLRQLVQRARRQGVRVYLYVNEPRAMQPAFFENRENIRGVREGDHFAMCTSAPEVRAWISEALEYVFRNVPDLGGAFTITASENLTNCASHYQWKQCPRCASRGPAPIIAEINRVIEEAVHRGNPDAAVIAWDWGWLDEWAGAVIEQLPRSIYLQSVSEWSLPINRGGIASEIGEYSISAVGPGPRATRHWELARKAGLRTMAKVQVNNTWELSAVPWLPAMNLVAEHASRLSRAGNDGLMLSWTLGGYPSQNLELVSRFFTGEPPTVEEALRAQAVARYGEKAAPVVLDAWAQFSRAFTEYPYNGALLYNGPQQVGPANPLYVTSTGYKATMVGFPYDDVKSWNGPYPPEVLGSQLGKVEAGWKAGLDRMMKARDAADGAYRANFEEDYRVAQAAWMHFRSSANQTRFIIARDAGKSREHLDAMRAAALDELELAKGLYTIASRDSRIGYEASNHYYYVPLDLAEKVINCRYVLDTLGQPAEK